MSSIPSFWKISKSFMDGKFKKVGKVYPLAIVAYPKLLAYQLS